MEAFFYAVGGEMKNRPQIADIIEKYYKVTRSDESESESDESESDESEPYDVVDLTRSDDVVDLTRSDDVVDLTRSDDE